MSNAKTGQKATFDKQESLQAVVFTNDFCHDLQLVQQTYSSVLFPVVTTPLLNFIMDNLIRSKVQQVFLYCSSYVDQMKKTIVSLKEFYENGSQDSIVITPIYSEGCRSLGDALRDIDTKGWIRGDFILIRSNAFANSDLSYLMEQHKHRREKDKNAAMTMVLRDFGSVKDSLLKKDGTIVVSNATNKKLLYYKKISDKNADKDKIDLELQWFLENDKLRIDTSLIDTHIYLCSASVLPFFADNFDFQTMEDFIQGVLMSEEFTESKIYWELLNCQIYALPINTWNSYRNLCRDILQRHCYPLVPDTQPNSLKNFIYMSRSTYKHSSSMLSKGCILESESIIGQSSSSRENSVIKKSIVGPNCSIGSNVKIENSFLISSIIISDNCKIRNSIIFDECSVARGTELQKCVVLPESQIREENKVYENCYFNVINGVTTCISLSESQTSPELARSFVNSDEENGEDDDGASTTSSLSRSSWSSQSVDQDMHVLPQDDIETFLSEVIDSLARGFQDKLRCENLILEINSSRYAYNVNMRQVSYNVVKAILKLPSQHGEDSAAYQKTLTSVIKYFQPILNNYIKTEDAQIDCLRAVQDVASDNQTTLLPCVKNLLHFLYNSDILSEEKILEWFENDLEGDDDSFAEQEAQKKAHEAVRNAALPFVNWLKEAEEDSSSDDD